MKVVLSKAIPLALPAVLLVWAYSPNTYFRNFGFPFAATFGSYVIAYLLVVAVSAIPPRVARRVSRDPIKVALTQIMIAALVFAALALVFGPIGFDLPGTRVRGIFFAEWNFVIFFFYVGLPVAITAGLVSLIVNKQPQSPKAAP